MKQEKMLKFLENDGDYDFIPENVREFIVANMAFDSFEAAGICDRYRGNYLNNEAFLADNPRFSAEDIDTDFMVFAFGPDEASGYLYFMAWDDPLAQKFGPDAEEYTPISTMSNTDTDKTFGVLLDALGDRWFGGEVSDDHRPIYGIWFPGYELARQYSHRKLAEETA